MNSLQSQEQFAGLPIHLTLEEVALLAYRIWRVPHSPDPSLATIASLKREHYHNASILDDADTWGVDQPALENMIRSLHSVEQQVLRRQFDNLNQLKRNDMFRVAAILDDRIRQQDNPESRTFLLQRLQSLGIPV